MADNVRSTEDPPHHRMLWRVTEVDSPRRQTVRQNASALFAGQLCTWGLTLVTLTALSRHIGASGVGTYSIGSTFGGLAATFAGFGIATLATKETARDRLWVADNLRSAFWLQMCAGAAAGLLAIVVGVASGYPSLELFAIGVSSAAVPAVLALTLVNGVVQGLEVMRWNAIFDVLAKALALVVLGIAIAFGQGVESILVYSTIAIYVVAGVELAWVERRVHAKLWRPTLTNSGLIFRKSAPFLITSVFWTLYASVDIVLLSRMCDSTTVGIYTTPSRIFGALLVVPVTITTALFPRLAAYFEHDYASMLKVVRKTLRVSVVVSIALAVACVSWSDPSILTIVFGDSFHGAGVIIIVLSISLVPTSISIVASRIAFAADREAIISRIGVGAFVAKVLLGIVLIPLFSRVFSNGALGAACGLVMTEALMTMVMIRFMPTGWLDINELAFYRRLCCAAALAITVTSVVYHMSPMASSFLGLAAYGCGLWLLGVFRPDISRRGLRRLVAEFGAGT